MPSHDAEPKQESRARSEGERQTQPRKGAVPGPGDPASPGARQVAQLQEILDRSASVQRQAALADRLNSRPQGIIQRYEGDPLSTLRSFLGDLLGSGVLKSVSSPDAAYRAVYAMYNRGAGPTRKDTIPANDDPVGTLSFGPGFGIPLRFVKQQDGFVSIDNPDYKGGRQEIGLTPQRISVHVKPEKILNTMLACYDQFRGMPRVSSFKMPSSQDAILNRMDNLVVYFLDDGRGTTKEELVSFFALLGNEENDFLLPEHPPMLEQTEVPGVGAAEGWYSFGDSRSRAIATAYMGWNKKGGVDGFLQATLKELRKQGFDTADLSKEAGEPKSGCFVSTACSRALGLADDCLELQALRWLRDGYVRRFPEGRREWEAYYDLGPAVVRSLAARPDSARIYRGIYRGLVAPVVSQVLAGDLAGGFSMYRRRVLGLARFLDGGQR